MKGLSFVVVFHNESDRLPNLLQSIKQEILTKERTFPISFLFIDNASTDQSSEVIQQFFSDQPNETWSLIQRSSNHMASARQQALEMAQHSHLVFVDADSLLAPDWQCNLTRAREGLCNDVAVIGGSSQYVVSEPWHRFVVPLSEYFPLGALKNQTTQVTHVPTNNYIVEVAKALEVGGFDPYFSYVGEDLDINVRLREKYQILFNPRFKVFHQLPQTEWHWYLKMVYYGRAQSLVALKYWGGVSWQKVLPAICVILTSITLLMQPLWGPLCFLLFLLIPRVRFYGLSFLFYGLGELLGFFRGFWDRCLGRLKPTLQATNDKAHLAEEFIIQ